MTASTMRPFRISASSEQLADLRERLRRTRFPDEVEGGGWEYGTDLAYLRELVEYWRERFDWPAAQAALNRLPQFTASVRDLTLHFVHQRGAGPAPLPLLFVHGWPGSFWELHKILGPLTDPAAHGGDPADAFDVVAPSLPGYGFSEGARTPGMSPDLIADLFATLMTETLGYSRFGAQGGDWGAWIGARLGSAHADKVLGIHLNLFPSRLYREDGGLPLTAEEQRFMAKAQAWRDAEGGYHAIQATKPQTLAVGLTDSPAGLAAWIVEKFRAWSDCDGEVERRFTKDELLTNVMIYWLSGSIGSSTRLYHEQRARPWSLGPHARVEVPTGFARFAFEITRPPRAWLERAVNLQHWSDFARGGHFAALEEPELLVEDLRAFFRPLRRRILSYPLAADRS